MLAVRASSCLAVALRRRRAQAARVACSLSQCPGTHGTGNMAARGQRDKESHSDDDEQGNEIESCPRSHPVKPPYPTSSPPPPVNLATLPPAPKPASVPRACLPEQPGGTERPTLTNSHTAAAPINYQLPVIPSQCNVFFNGCGCDRVADNLSFMIMDNLSFKRCTTFNHQLLTISNHVTN